MRNFRGRRFAAVLAAAMVVAGSSAHAQSYAFDEQTVAGRERARDSDLGVRFGSFTLVPSVAADVSYTDNLFDTDTDRRGDEFLSLRPEINLRSNFAHNALGARAYFARDFHRRYSSENVSNYGLSADGRYDLAADTTLSGNLQLERAAESRGSLGSFRQTARPSQFSSLAAEATLAQNLGDLNLAGSGRVRRISYSDALLGNLVIDQAFRNLLIYSGTVQGGYAVDQQTRVLVTGTAERRVYDVRRGEIGFDPLTAIDRSADGGRVEVGVTREVTSLIYFALRVGYLAYDYADPRLRNVSGFSYFGTLRWNVTPLTTIDATAARQLDETTSPVTAGNLRDQFTLRVDHELLRTLVLQGDVTYARISPAGLQVSSREFFASARARYSFTRTLGLEGALLHSQRSSDDRSIAFRSNVATLGLRLSR